MWRSAGSVRRGRVFNIEPSRAVPHPNRPGATPYQHRTDVNRGGRSDRAVTFELHGGVGHLDSLRHIRYREFGPFGGRQEADLDTTPELGIQRWAEHSAVGRGVLLDVAGHLARRGATLAADRRFAITGELLDAVTADEFQHRRILAMLGMGIGELFTFADLAGDCARDGVYEFMVTVNR